MSVSEENYPKHITLKDGVEISITMMTTDDRDAVLTFANDLSEQDMMFLRVDITQPEVVDDWMNNLETGRSVSIAAYDDNGLIGYASVHRNAAPWTRRVGEIRVNVSAEYRARGLGKHLTSEIFAVARGLGLRKLMANMTADQQSAQAAFRKLGFVPEALLADYVEDMSGMSHDLVIMSHDVEGHTDSVEGTVKL